MKILICGDLHFGIRNNSLSYLEFQSKWFREELFTNIKKYKCDKIIFLGDVFDSRNSLSPLILNRTRELFKELMTYNIKTYCITGNHDLYFRNNKSVHSLDMLTDQGIKVFKEPKTLMFENKKILFLPWIINNEKETVANLLINDNYDFCFGHLEINEFEKIKGIIEKDGFNQTLFANCNKVFSGHFHLRKKINNILYTGTPYELNWNDYKDVKGIHIIDDDNIIFVPSKNTPQHIKISNLKYNISELNKSLIETNIIKLIFDDKISEIDKINYIEKINSLQPLSCIIEDALLNDFDSNSELESDIKDTLGFLNEYVNLIEIPENLSKKNIIEKIEELYNTCI